jgi:hypothetical protein
LLSYHLAIAQVTCWFSFNRESFSFDRSSLFPTITISLVSRSRCQVRIVGGSAHDGTGALFAHLRDMHVLLQKSTVQVAALLKCSCGRLWSPSSSLYLFFYSSSSLYATCCANGYVCLACTFVSFAFAHPFDVVLMSGHLQDPLCLSY